MVASKRDRDTAMRIICDFHEKREPGNSIGPVYLTRHGLSEKANAEYVVEVLRSMGYVTYDRTPDGRIYRIDLTDTGKCYFEQKSDITRKERIEWIRYIITTAIAVAAFIKSFFF